MPDSKRQPRTHIWKFAGLALGLLAAFIIGYMASSVNAYLNSLAPEYHSARTINDVAEFVRENDAWPTAWTDLGHPPLEGVVVNWSIDIASCDRYDVMTAIVPITRRYQTYPHAESDLDALWKAVQERRNTRRESRSSHRLPLTGDARE